MNAILSIKPKFAEQILAGTKKVEFRKVHFKIPVNRVYIYSSAPTMRLVGYFTLKQVVKASPKALWEQYNMVGGIDEQSFFQYFGSSQEGYSLCIDKVVTFENGIDPNTLIPGFVAPQSYRYWSESYD